MKSAPRRPRATSRHLLVMLVHRCGHATAAMLPCLRDSADFLTLLVQQVVVVVWVVTALLP